MSEPSTVSENSASAQAEPIVNRLSIQVATVNGSGSQTANSTLLRLYPIAYAAHSMRWRKVWLSSIEMAGS